MVATGAGGCRIGGSGPMLTSPLSTAPAGDVAACEIVKIRINP